jgi:hypothetical protein
MILGWWWNESRSCCPAWIGSFATGRSVADCKQLVTLGRVEGDLMSGSLPPVQLEDVRERSWRCHQA